MLYLLRMIDPELTAHLVSLEKKLDALNKRNRFGSYFLGGLVSGVGYITGAAIVLVVVGWILNIVGVIPAFNSFVASFQHALNVISSASLH